MIAKSVMTALLGSTLLATAALAQSPSTSTTTPPPAEKMAPAGTTATMSHQGQWRASKVVNLKIYNDGNESLGTVNDLLMDSQGKITTAVIGVGGFLGMGEHYVAVPFEKIKWVDTPAPSASASGTTGRPSTTTSTGAGTTTGAATTTTTTTATPLAKPNPGYPDHGVLSVTKEELKAMPEFKYSS